jgi:hypothetical protein
MHFFSCSSSFLFLSCPLLFCFLLIAHFFHLCSLLTTLAHCNLSLAPICHHLILFIVNHSYLLSFSPVHYWMLVIACAYLLTIEYLPLLVLICSLLNTCHCLCLLAHYWMLAIACAYLLTIEFLSLLVLTCSLLNTCHCLCLLAHSCLCHSALFIPIHFSIF